MRVTLAALFLAGCGSPLDPLPAPVHRERVVSDGGTSHVHPVTKPEPTTTCTIEIYDPFGGAAYSARRESVDAKGRPLQKTNGLTFDTYGYDGDRIVSAPPNTFAYEGDVLTVDAEKALIGYYRLDAHDRVLGPLADSKSDPYMSYAYDDAGRLVTHSYSGGTLSWTYDEHGFLASERSQSSGSETCRRTWSWDHGAVESVTVTDGTRTVQSCSYAFDSKDRLLSARCRYATALWSYQGDAATMTLSQSGSLTNVERMVGTCDTPTRSNLARGFEPVAGDPRPSKMQLRRLASTPVPSPSRDCAFFGAGPGEGVLL